MSTDHRHSFRLANDPADIAPAVDRVRRLVAECGGDASVQQRFALVFDELLSNIVKYAYPAGTAHVIDCGIGRNGAALVATIADHGAPFNPLEQPQPDLTAPMDGRDPGGIGIPLVRRMMDEVRYERQGDRNIVTLKKLLDAPRGKSIDASSA